MNKKNNHYIFGFCILFSLIFTACSHPNAMMKWPPSQLKGIWVNVNTGTELEFLPNNSFMMAKLGLEGQAIVGKVKYEGDRVSFTNGKRTGVCVGETGVYTYRRDGNTLNFSQVNDTCPKRVSLMESTWVLKI